MYNLVMEADRRGQWLRGVLDLCLLAVLAGGEGHGYGLIQRLETSGMGRVKGGTLYPVLARLEQAGLVVAQWRAGEHGPGRKYYCLTKAGADFLRSQAQAWRAFTESTNTLLGDREESS